MLKPKISVIMPVYNSEKYIKQAIDSILEQTYTNFELIIIDDCPQDNTMDIVLTYKDERIHIIHNQKNSGIAYSRNQGLAYSTGKYIAIMDHDDVSLQYRFEKQVDFLDKNEEIDVLGGRIQLIDSDGVVIRPSNMVYTNPQFIKALFLFRNVYCNSEVMFRKKLLDEYCIKYQDKCLGMEDFRFWIECSKVGKMSNIDELLLQHRLTADNETNRVKRELTVERERLFADMQKYSLYQNGFRLSEDCLEVLTKIITETSSICQSKDELKMFYKSIKEIIYQSKVLKLTNCKEIEIVCRRHLTEKISAMNDDFWEEFFQY